jgi:hypothetical protein
MSRNRMMIAVLAALGALAVLPQVRADDFVYDARGKRNPFIPLVTSDGRYLKLEAEEQKKEEELRLEGIIYDKYGISYAVVNGIVVKTGDLVGEYQVLKIDEKEVLFMREGQEKRVELKAPGS